MAPAIVSRDVYYAGAKHLVPILQLLIPGIDLVCEIAGFPYHPSLLSTVFRLERPCQNCKSLRSQSLDSCISNGSTQLCTTAFLVEISQHIKIGDLSGFEQGSSGSASPRSSPTPHGRIPVLSLDDAGAAFLNGDVSSPKEEDALLQVPYSPFLSLHPLPSTSLGHHWQLSRLDRKLHSSGHSAARKSSRGRAVWISRRSQRRYLNRDICTKPF